jgi:hypothetical protein
MTKQVAMQVDNEELKKLMTKPLIKVHMRTIEPHKLQADDEI